MITVSAVIPVFSGEEYLESLVDEIERVRSLWAVEGAPLALVEAIFVDDGAADDSARILAELSAKHSWIQVVTLARNFGQHPATIAGILHTSGNWVVTLDEDLQHRPEHILRLLRLAVTDGLDIVYANPEQAVHQSLVRDLGSRGYKRLVGFLSGNPNIKVINSFRLLRGGVARAAASVCSHETYFDIALSWFSDRIGSLSLPMKDQRFIESKQSSYNIRSLLSHARRMVLSSQTKFLRAGGLLGIASIVVSIAFGIRVLIARFLDPQVAEVRGWTSLVLAVLFFGGVLSCLMSVALEYLTTVMLRIQGKPTYFEVVRSSDAVLREFFERDQSA